MLVVKYQFLDYAEDEHTEDRVAEKPHRYELPGCEKSWHCAHTCPLLVRAADSY